MSTPVYKRVLLKLSGEAISAGKDGILNFDYIREIADVIKKCMEKGVLVIKAKHKVRLLPALNIPFPPLVLYAQFFVYYHLYYSIFATFIQVAHCTNPRRHPLRICTNKKAPRRALFYPNTELEVKLDDAVLLKVIGH